MSRPPLSPREKCDTRGPYYDESAHNAVYAVIRRYNSMHFDVALERWFDGACVHCNAYPEDHIDMKCPFAPTEYVASPEPV